ncbi:MAG TPA: phosphoribosylformylglycinamidine synthase subunit PurQ, partial [Ottowia sp.]|nr:phosphoribosylformylglycinamidine synthase subunit PurQ [Ottowia sp.]
MGGLRWRRAGAARRGRKPLPRRLPKRAPRVAILREQGVNGHAEMAWAFTRAGFTAVDVHMSDLLSGRLELSGFTGLAAC